MESAKYGYESRLHTLSHVDISCCPEYVRVFFTLLVVFIFLAWQSEEESKHTIPMPIFTMQLNKILLLIISWVFCAASRCGHIPGKP